jgi:aspartate ammonia-lyase
MVLEVFMPAKKYYGKETEKALSNFGKGNIGRDLIRAYGEVKKSCLFAMQEHGGVFDKEIFSFITEAVNDVIDGFLDRFFPLPIEQGGAGTSINMNINEVIANRSSELIIKKTGKKVKIDPISDINRYQSTNDTFPTAVTVMLYRHLSIIETLVIRLQEVLINKENETGNILMTGRTEMQDALPITLGQVFASWAGPIERDRWRLNKLKERIRLIALGGTALGTCFSAPRDYIFLAEKYLRDFTGLPLSRSQNLTDEIANQDKWEELASGYSILAQNIFKMTGDLIIYTSSLAGEISHPELQYGSTIMAAKTNPVILEYARGLSIEIRSRASMIMEFSRNGQLQLNPYLPFIAGSFIEIFSLITKMIDSLTEKFFPLMKINHSRIEENLVHSNVLFNTLLPVIGYYRVKELYRAMEGKHPKTMEEYKTLIRGFTGLSPEEIDKLFDPLFSASPGKTGRPC